MTAKPKPADELAALIMSEAYVRHYSEETGDYVDFNLKDVVAHIEADRAAVRAEAMTPAELTALLAPVRLLLDEIAKAADQRKLAGESTNDPGLESYAVGMRVAVERLRAELDKLDPHQDRAYVTLAVAALGMLRELRESPVLKVTGNLVEGRSESIRDWNDRADQLIAGAFPGWKPPS